MPKIKNETTLTGSDQRFLDELKDIVIASRKFAYSTINLAQVRQNWLLGQKIVMQEQRGQARAAYGQRVIKIASQSLTAAFGKGFSQRNLWKFKQFFLMFGDLPILPTLSAESDHLPLLCWSHYERLMRVSNEEERRWYRPATYGSGC